MSYISVICFSHRENRETKNSFTQRRKGAKKSGNGFFHISSLPSLLLLPLRLCAFAPLREILRPNFCLLCVVCVFSGNNCPRLCGLCFSTPSALALIYIYVHHSRRQSKTTSDKDAP